MRFSELLGKLADGQPLNPIEKQELILQARQIEQSEAIANGLVLPGTNTLKVDNAVIGNAQITDATIITATAGEGAVVLDTNGLTITQGASATDTTNAIKWTEGGVETVRQINYGNAGTNYLTTRMNSITGKSSLIELSADSEAGKQSQVTLLVSEALGTLGTATLSKNTFEVAGVPIYGETMILNDIGTPAYTPAVSAEAVIYVKGSKLVVKFDDAGTTKYFYLDMTTAANQSWIYTTTAP